MHQSPNHNLPCEESSSHFTEEVTWLVVRGWVSLTPKLSSIKAVACQSHVWPSTHGRCSSTLREEILASLYLGKLRLRGEVAAQLVRGLAGKAHLDLLTWRPQEAKPSGSQHHLFQEASPLAGGIGLLHTPRGITVVSHADQEPRGFSRFPGAQHILHSKRKTEKSQGIQGHQFPRPLLCCRGIRLGLHQPLA